jgi:hypothetical protein
MTWKILAAAAAIAVAFGAGCAPPLVNLAEASECVPGDKIDASTAETARKKIEAAGFRQVEDLQKGCDNFWHGKATKDGAPVNVVLSPQGQVMTEGN